MYEAIQAAAKQVPGLKRRQAFAGVQTPAVGAATRIARVSVPRQVLSDCDDAEPRPC